MPASIQFLGYNPLPESTTLAERLVRQRTTLGLSRKGAALAIGVDAATLARREFGERAPAGEFRDCQSNFMVMRRHRRRTSGWSC